MVQKINMHEKYIKYIIKTNSQFKQIGNKF